MYVVAYATGRQLENHLHCLVEKLEQLQQQKEESLRHSQQTAVSLTRILHLFDELEQLHHQELTLVHQVESIQGKLNHIDLLDIAEEIPPNKVGFMETCKKIIPGIKTAGQVIDIVSDGLINILDSIEKIKSQGKTKETAVSKKDSETLIDLSALLQPMGDSCRS